MDRILKTTKGKSYLYGYASYKEIYKYHKDKNILNIFKYKLCPCCKDGYLEVEDKRGLKILQELKKEE